MMTRILGELPQHVVRRTKTPFFLASGRLSWDWSQPAARYASQHCRPLPQYRCGHTIRGNAEQNIAAIHNQCEHK